MGAVLAFTAKLESLTCSCGMEFAVPERYLNDRRKDGKTFYCPAGHNLSWTETETEKLQKQLAAKERELASARETSQARLEWAQRSDRRLIASRGQLTKLRKRVGNGVCPCCKRTFRDLARHMGTKHPEFKGEDDT